MARRPSLSLFCLLLAGAAASGCANAAELGEARVSSHIGQQLVADIELQDSIAPLQVRLASADVYRGAGLVMPAVLSGLDLSVIRRDGRQFVHITSLAPVQSGHLHLYLELTEGEQRSVRLATLWLAPDPRPAPPPAAARPLPQAQPASRPEPEANAAAKPVFRPVPRPAAEVQAAGNSLPQGVTKDAPIPAPAPKVAPSIQSAPRLTRQAQVVQTPTPAVLPAKPSPSPLPAHKPEPAPKSAPSTPPARASGPVAQLAPKPAQQPKPEGAVVPVALGQAAAVPALPAALARSAAPVASCVPSPASPQLKACVALDYKNAALKDQIGKLEDKVRVLQLAMGAAPASVMAGAVPSAQVQPVLRKQEKTIAAENAFPWLLLAVGSAALLVAAAAAAVVARRRKGQKAAKAKRLRAGLPEKPG